MSENAIRKDTDRKTNNSKIESSIFVGKKPIINYAKAIAIQLKEKDNQEITIKSRGKFISKAVDIAQLVTKRLLKSENLLIDDIKLDTESFEHEGKKINVSTIEIKIKRT